MKHKLKYSIILAIFLISLAGSIILSFVSIEKACGQQEDNGCYQVQTSQYEKTLGISNGYIGIVAFLALSILTIAYMKRIWPKKRFQVKFLIHMGIIITLIFSLYFIYLQIFVIKALCKYCLTIDIGAIINFAIILFWKGK